MTVEQTRAALERLAKWRKLFTGWQLGTRAEGDPEADAVRDHREVTILLRAETSTLIRMLVDKGVFTAAEFTAALGEEAEMLSTDYSKRFPGITATDLGLEFNVAIMHREGTMRFWRP